MYEIASGRPRGSRRQGGVGAEGVGTGQVVWNHIWHYTQSANTQRHTQYMTHERAEKHELAEKHNRAENTNV